MKENGKIFPGQMQINREAVKTFYKQYQADPSSASLDLIKRMCGLAIDLGYPFIAFDVLRSCQESDLDDDLTYLFGFACASVNSLDAAIRFLDKNINLKRFDHLTLLGRVYKNYSKFSHDIADRKTSIAMAKGYYNSALRLAVKQNDNSKIFYSSINVASLSHVLGNSADATKFARLAKEKCEDSLKKGISDQWVLATLGESELLLGDTSKAFEFYSKALQTDGITPLQIASMKAQYETLMEVSDRVFPGSHVVFPSSKICCFTGHMIDSPNRTGMRFGEGMVDEVRRQIGEAIENQNVSIGYSSAACGSDILFLQEMQKRNLETNIILPYEVGEFLDRSVSFAGDYWIESFKEVIDKAISVVSVRDDSSLEDDLTYAFTNQMIQGLARIRSSHLKMLVFSLAVLSPGGIRKSGGAQDAIELWRKSGNVTEIIELPNPLSTQNKDTISWNPPEPKIKRDLVAMLFADAAGFSKLKDSQILVYSDKFLGSIAQTLRRYDSSILFNNTWGDGLFVVGNDIQKMGELALEIQRDLKKFSWESFGLPKDLALRIALHAGPVTEVDDLITKRKNYFGHFVNEASRIEPITPVGEVYASYSYAALSEMTETKSFKSEYVGDMPLAKNYGSLPMYHLRLLRSLSI